ncbi:YbdK family carboxylate-amine ligase [Leifsonia sp. NPDC058194]|uniref:carboxylate-amine ligase n=1 Tax=Leifsonia sp. NPDC058194 TaxID=3346374 RepID=UPI0036DDBCF4
MRTTLGVEEEFVLLDPVTLTPVARAADAVTALGGPRREGGAVTQEFFPSQLEYATPVCDTAAEASEALEQFRRALRAWASDAGLLAAGVGLPYRTAHVAQVTDEERYRDIASRFGLVVPDHQLNGLHVHVGVGDRDEAIVALNRLRPWLPALLALSANSPFWRAEDTGFDSWRAIHSRRWTTHGIPPAFLDAADYDRRAGALSGIGGTVDAGTLNWVVRPSERYPTVEVRVFDAQLDGVTSTALAALVRGLVTTPPEGDVDLLPLSPELLDAAHWHAARDGLGGELVNPLDGRLRPAPEVVEALLAQARPGLVEHGDASLVAAAVARLLSDGNGATRQRRALAQGGTSGLADLVSGSADAMHGRDDGASA